MSDGIRSVMLFCIPNRMGVVEIDDWRKLQGQELRDLHSSPNVIKGYRIRKDGMGTTCCLHGIVYKGLGKNVKKSEGNGLLGKN